MNLAALPVPVVIDASWAIEVALGSPTHAKRWASWLRDDRMLLGPALIWAEIANALMLGPARMSAADATDRVEALALAGLEATDRGIRGVREAARLVERHRLTVYNAMYLQLAIDVDGELASHDRALRRAADAEGITDAD
ncbi:MAG: type II toxin-antitoxin system VapC family toxin [Candidatus Limnocylindrales bacterium]